MWTAQMLRAKWVGGQTGVVFVQQLDYAEIIDVAYDRSASVRGNVWIHDEYGGDEYFRTQEDHGKDWLGGLTSKDHLVRLHRDGWREGLGKVMKLKDEIATQIDPPRSIRRRPVFQDSGDEIDRDRLYGGQVDSMWRVAKRRSSQGPRVVTVYCQIGDNCNRSPEHMFYSGACALVVTELLEDAGYRVEIRTASAAEGYRANETGPCTAGLQIISVKEAREPLRSDIVAFAACHAGFFRVFDFLLSARVRGHVPDHLGSAVSTTSYLSALSRGGFVDPPDITFPGFLNVDGCVKAINQALAKVTGANARVT